MRLFSTLILLSSLNAFANNGIGIIHYQTFKNQSFAQADQIVPALIQIIKAQTATGGAVIFERGKVKNFISNQLVMTAIGFYGQPIFEKCEFLKTEGLVRCRGLQGYDIRYGRIPKYIWRSGNYLLRDQAIESVRIAAQATNQRKFKSLFGKFEKALEQITQTQALELPDLGYIHNAAPGAKKWTGYRFTTQSLEPYQPQPLFEALYVLIPKNNGFAKYYTDDKTLISQIQTGTFSSSELALLAQKLAKPLFAGEEDERERLSRRTRTTGEGELQYQFPVDENEQEVIIPLGYRLTDDCVINYEKQTLDCLIEAGSPAFEPIDLRWVHFAPQAPGIIKVVPENGVVYYQTGKQKDGEKEYYPFQYNFYIQFKQPNTKKFGKKLYLNTTHPPGDVWVHGGVPPKDWNGGLVLWVNAGYLPRDEHGQVEKIKVQYYWDGGVETVDFQYIADTLVHLAKGLFQGAGIKNSDYQVEEDNEDSLLVTRTPTLFTNHFKYGLGTQEQFATIFQKRWDKILEQIGKVLAPEQVPNDRLNAQAILKEFLVLGQHVFCLDKLVIYENYVQTTDPQDCLIKHVKLSGQGVVTVFNWFDEQIANILELLLLLPRDEQVLVIEQQAQGVPPDQAAVIGFQTAARNEFIVTMGVLGVTLFSPGEWAKISEGIVRGTLNIADIIGKRILPRVYYPKGKITDQVRNLRDLVYSKHEALHGIVIKLDDLTAEANARVLTANKATLEFEVILMAFENKIDLQQAVNIKLSQSYQTGQLSKEVFDAYKTELDVFVTDYAQVQNALEHAIDTRARAYFATQKTAQFAWEARLPDPYITEINILIRYWEADRALANPEAFLSGEFLNNPVLETHFTIPSEILAIKDLGTRAEVARHYLMEQYQKLKAVNFKSPKFKDILEMSPAEIDFLKERVESVKTERLTPSPLILSLAGRGGEDTVEILLALRDQVRSYIFEKTVERGKLLKQADTLVSEHQANLKAMYAHIGQAKRQLMQMYKTPNISKQELQNWQKQIEMLREYYNASKKLGYDYKALEKGEAQIALLTGEIFQGNVFLRELNENIEIFGGQAIWKPEPEMPIVPGDWDAFHYRAKFSHKIENFIPPKDKGPAIAVVGSRNIKKAPGVGKVVMEIIPRDYFKAPKPGVIVSGGAKGADQIAEAIADHFDLPKWIFPAKWDQLGKTAGFVRNTIIVEKADVVVAIGDSRYPTRGTTDTIEKAFALDKPVYFFDVNQNARSGWMDKPEWPLIDKPEQGQLLRRKYGEQPIVYQ